MFRNKKTKYIFTPNFVALFLSIVMLVSVLQTRTFATEVPPPGDRIIVSLGDSYSSGEGIEPFYGQNLPISDRVKNPDWLAHRSENAWSGMLTLPFVNGKMSENENRNKHWFFAAASGATRDHLLNKQVKEYDKEGCPPDSGELAPQLDIFEKLNGKKADYITLTLGGNDVDFKGILEKVVMGTAYLDISGLSKKLNDTWEKFYADGGIEDNLRDSYEEIAKRAGDQAHIIVVGYPQLLEPSGKGFPVSKKEATLVNTAVSRFNNAIEHLVNQCSSSGLNISFVSVEKAFAGHEAYSKEPYIKELILGSQEQDLMEYEVCSSYSFHPNYDGACAYAKCVQNEIDQLEGLNPVTYSTDFSVSTYGYDGQLYKDYSIIIDGKENIAFGGLISKDYHDEISVSKAMAVPMSLPRGTYTITVTDGSNAYFQKIKTRKDSDNKSLIFDTQFKYVNQSKQFNQSDIPPDAVEFNSHYYYVYNLDTVTTWEEAKQYCESQGGYLATITSQEEDKFVYSYLKDTFGYESAYFGFTDQAEEGTWVWDNGEVSSYTNWHSGEPNGQNSNEDFAMYYYKYSDGSWNDGNFGLVKGQRPFICEWGEYQSASDSQPQEPVTTTSDERDIVLVLDASSSMDGTPMEETKKASINFVNTILEEDASIGIVTYDSKAERVADFSVNKNYLIDTINDISCAGITSIESGLVEAKSMLDRSNAKKKIIVLMSDGEPNKGKQGEELIAYADAIKNDGILIYTLGFFESAENQASAQYLMERLASGGCHYEVANADDLVFFFGDIADQINGQKYIYVRIACPVDVTVNYNGETLCSVEDDLNTRTDFGTLTFEDAENAAGEKEDDSIKVLRLKEGVDYDVQIVGTGHGMMNYTIGFMDENGDYSDLRQFENIKITRQTVIDTVAAVSDESVLNIDEDGDGKYDLKLRAGENEYGEEVKLSAWIYVCICGGAALLILIALVILRANSKKGKVEF